MGRAIALKPWTFNARGATVLDEEVAGLQMDVEWTLPLRAKRKTSSMHSLNRRSQLVRLGLPSRFGDSTVPMSFPPYLSDAGGDDIANSFFLRVRDCVWDRVRTSSGGHRRPSLARRRGW